MATDYTQYVEQGATFTTSVTVEGVDLTNATVSANMRRDYTSITIIPFTVTVVDASSGSLLLGLSATQTAALWPGRYVYDATYTIGSNVVRIIEGIVVVSPTAA